MSGIKILGFRKLIFQKYIDSEVYCFEYNFLILYEKAMKKKNTLWQANSPLFYLPPNTADVFPVPGVHTGQFIISKFPTCMDLSNRSIILVFLLFCKLIGNLNFSCHL